MPEHARDQLELLIRIISDLSAVEDELDLIRLLINGALEFTNAERGYFIRQKSPGVLDFMNSRGESEPNPVVSLSTIRQVMEKNAPSCLIENSDGESIIPTASILALNLKTIMCAPLSNKNGSPSSQPMAALYVDSRIVTRAFDRQDLDFFTILADHAAVVLNNLHLTGRLQNDFKLLHDEVRSKYDYHRIVGQCDSMKQVYQVLEMLRDTDLDVIIVGETGAGKELIAKAIHYASRRSQKPLKQLNCAALPEGLVEAELFGVEKNVATEVGKRPGKLEQADGGTLFLDEIGDMPIRIQNRLLRFLEERKYRRIGGRDEMKADVRVIAATNKNLGAEIKAGRFRDALRYRLEVIAIKLPPLRERGEDLELLADFFLKEIVDEYNLQIKGFTAEAWSLMKNYNWPGNVRELKHRVQGAAFLAKGQLIEEYDLGLKKPEDLAKIIPLEQRIRNYEKQIIQNAFNRFQGNEELTASALDISIPMLKRKIANYRIIVQPEFSAS
jgi:DNA-binding NtrC family response regulator